MTEFKSGKFCQMAGWDDVAWLDDQVKHELLASTPLNLRESRKNGHPSMGEGNVYHCPLEQVICKDREIPKHWKRLYALDVGYNRTAAIFGAINPEDDTVYLYSEHYQGHVGPNDHALAIRARFKAAGYEIPGLIDPASAGSSQIDGRRLIDIYRRDCGLRVREAENSVEAGIYAVTDRLNSGRLKVFASLKNWQSEYMIYRRDDRGRPIKEKDHLMDATRYLVMGLRYAKAAPTQITEKRGDGITGRNYFNGW